MNRSYLAVGVVGVALTGLWSVARPPAAALAPPAPAPRIDAPAVHDNLAVYFIHGPDAVDDRRVVSLQEALANGWAVVHETGDVNRLVIENVSADRELFVQTGDMIKGGRQDRMIASDVLLSPGTGRVDLPVHCVEHGRWSGRGTEAPTQFARSDNFAVGKELKVANATGNQGAVWENVAANQTKLSQKLGVEVRSAQSASSLQLTLENPALQAGVADYEAALLGRGQRAAGVVGVVFVVNGQVTGAEVYGSNGLFRKAWPKLLNAAAVEALAEKGDPGAAPPPPVWQVESFLASAAAEPPPPPQAAAFTGRSGATRQTLSRSSGGRQGWVILGDGTANAIDLDNNAALANMPPVQRPANPGLQQQDGQLIVAGSAIQFNPPPQQAGMQQELRRQTEGQIRVNLHRPQPGRAAPSPNRLNTNRVENATAVVLEARDASRPGVVVHQSFIPQPAIAHAAPRALPNAPPQSETRFMSE